MKGRSKSAREAEARYEAQGRKGHSVTVRLSDDEMHWLDAQGRPGESHPATLRRLAKMPGWRERAKVKKEKQRE